MAATFDTAPMSHTPALPDDEPWPIWAAVMVFLNLLVIATMTNGLAGLVSVMVPAAVFMLLILVLIVVDGLKPAAPL